MEPINYLSQLSQMAYESQPNGNLGDFALIESTIDPITGFAANAHLNLVTGEVVFSFAGTTEGNPQDYATDIQLGIGNIPLQAQQAEAFVAIVLYDLATAGNTIGSVTYTGHSLGGYIAQHVIVSGGTGTAMVFNSPGYGGVTGALGLQENSITYVYSNPNEWGGLNSFVVGIGDVLSSNVVFVMDADGHGLDSILVALENGSVPISEEAYLEILVEAINLAYANLSNNPGAIAELVDDLGTIPQELWAKALERSQLNDSCFLATTPILMADGSEKPIEHIKPGDLVKSYNKEGNLVAGRVKQTFVKEVEHVLDFFGTGVTPGHVYYCGAGKFKGQHVPLIDILRDDGGVVAADGTLIRAATGMPIGSENDVKMVWAVRGTKTSSGAFQVSERKKIRLSTRVITEAGSDLSVADILKGVEAYVNKNAMIQVDRNSDAEMPFHWTFSESIPKPEDYVLQRSGLTLREVNNAAEWEGENDILHRTQTET